MVTLQSVQSHTGLTHHFYFFDVRALWRSGLSARVENLCHLAYTKANSVLGLIARTISYKSYDVLQISANVLQNSVKQDVNKQIEEDREIEKRQNNIIIYRVPEINSDDVEDRKDGDLAFVTDLLGSVFEIEPESNTVDKLFRLGRRVVPFNVPRRLLVGFHSHDIKEKVMSKLKNLKEAEERFNGISLAHDMTPWQRTEMKRLVEQAKQNHASTSSDGAENYWFRVVGQGTKMRVVKVKKQSQVTQAN